MIDEQSLDHAYSFLPFWDTKLADGTKDNSVYLRKQMKLSLADAYNFTSISQCHSIREFVLFYENNHQVDRTSIFSFSEVIS